MKLYFISDTVKVRDSNIYEERGWELDLSPWPLISLHCFLHVYLIVGTCVMCWLCNGVDAD